MCNRLGLKSDLNQFTELDLDEESITRKRILTLDVTCIFILNKWSIRTIFSLSLSLSLFIINIIPFGYDRERLPTVAK